MHKEPETLGEILKTARMRADITMETLAERVDITERYLYRIENEGKKPSFDVLYKLIRELAIPADSIFYPEKPSKDSEIENLVRMLYGCNERSRQSEKHGFRIVSDFTVDLNFQNIASLSFLFVFGFGLRLQFTGRSAVKGLYKINLPGGVDGVTV